MAAPPSGTVTFLFTDIEDSTRRWDEQPEAMQHALARHDAILCEAIERHGGYVFKTVGDAFHAAFATAPDALRAAVDAQRALSAVGWGGAVRTALHTGTADERDGDYFGPALNRVARLRDAGHGGQILLTAVTQALVRGHIPDGVELRDMGLHRLRDLAEPEHVSQVAVWGLPADFPPLRTTESRSASVPRPLTDLIGREREVATVAALLRAARLVTLTGPGGTGKTRLAVAVAELVGADFPDGVIFVDLSPLSDPVLVSSTIAVALGLREHEGQPIVETLRLHLREKRLLLVLDNFEQVVETAPLLSDLLSAAPRLVVLVTSRVRLRLSGEREYPVPPLDLPDRATIADLAALVLVPSMALFVQRAQAARPNFMLTTANAGAIADICLGLDGLPLALELAAARIRVLSPQALHARLGQRLPVLVGSDRDRPQRHQTLRATIDWSYGLLTPNEQALFRGLAVFVDGWTLEAAQAVCDVGSDRATDVLEGLGSLVEQSLIRAEEGMDGEPRFTMLETIREHGLEQLTASGEADAWYQRHATYYLALAEQAEPDLWRGANTSETMQRLEREHGNLRAALGWAVMGGEREIALRLAGALQGFWIFGGHLSEGRRWLEAAVADSGSVKSKARAQALFGLGRVCEEQGDYLRAEWAFEESLALARRLGDLSGMGGCLVCLGGALFERGEATRAAALFEESLASIVKRGTAPALPGRCTAWGGWHGRTASRSAPRRCSRRASRCSGASAITEAQLSRSKRSACCASPNETTPRRRSTSSKASRCGGLSGIGRVSPPRCCAWRCC